MSETFSSGQRNERSLSSRCDLWALGGWGASLLLLLLLLLLIPRMPLCPCHHWALSLAPPVVLLVLFFLMSKWTMVTASYKQVLGKKRDVNSGDPQQGHGEQCRSCPALPLRHPQLSRPRKPGSVPGMWGRHEGMARCAGQRLAKAGVSLGIPVMWHWDGTVSSAQV